MPIETRRADAIHRFGHELSSNLEKSHGDSGQEVLEVAYGTIGSFSTDWQCRKTPTVQAIKRHSFDSLSLYAALDCSGNQNAVDTASEIEELIVGGEIGKVEEWRGQRSGRALVIRGPGRSGVTRDCVADGADWFESKMNWPEP